MVAEHQVIERDGTLVGVLLANGHPRRRHVWPSIAPSPLSR
ncbi:MAG TPA: hypothetical protein VED63_10525 [Acidimicrobiales bacterium]|nr:hypothetical protein [Acidimicrobiales bacterium]